jgi:hypothetical protein
MSDWNLLRKRRRKRRDSFAPTSAEIESSVDEYLKNGGEITVLPRQNGGHSVQFDQGQTVLSSLKSRGFHG